MCVGGGWVTHNTTEQAHAHECAQVFGSAHRQGSMGRSVQLHMRTGRPTPLLGLAANLVTRANTQTHSTGYALRPFCLRVRPCMVGRSCWFAGSSSSGGGLTCFTLSVKTLTLTQVLRHHSLQHRVLPVRPAAPAQQTCLLAVALLGRLTTSSTCRLPKRHRVGVERDVQQAWWCELMMVAAGAEAFQEQQVINELSAQELLLKRDVGPVEAR